MSFSYLVLLIYDVTLSDPYSAATLFGGVTDWYQSQVIENQWVFEDELEAPDVVPQSPRQAPPSPDYVPSPKEPEHAPISPDYVPELEYPEYLVPYDAEAHIEDQPLPDDASPVALSPGYVVDSDPKEDPEEDPEEDPADYPADGRDDDDESSDNDDDDDDDEEEQEDSEDDDKEEEEHPALADSSAVPVTLFP
ncbi:hypothetical protein Tco_1080454 [Tanacetum coccineum]|uniref:Uncharacterized protein n=1 Tax=Tanacetum coccineum TaxID=301880 RepID=A0ABQ5HVM8_9ASTR